MAINKTKPNYFSPEEIEAFEAKNKNRGKVQTFCYPSDANPDTPAVFFVAKPNRFQIEAVTVTAEKQGMTAGNDLLLNTSILAGDVEQLEDDDNMYFGLLKDVAALLEAKKKI